MKINVLLLPLLIIPLLFSCKESSTDPIENLDSNKNNIVNNLEILTEYHVKNNLIDFNEMTGDLVFNEIPLQKISSNVYFVEDNPGDEKFDLEDYIILPPTKKTPNGQLLKITSIVKESGQIQLSTIPAALNEIINECNVNFNYTYTEDDVDSLYLYSNPKEKRLYKGYDIFSLPIDFETDPNPKDLRKDSYIRFKGLIELAINLDFELEVNKTLFATTGIKKFQFDIRPELISQLKAEYGGKEPEINYSYQVAEYELDPIEFAIGPVPVIITNSIPINISFESKIGENDSVVVELVKNMDYKIGFKYLDGNFSPVNEFTIHDHPTLSINDPMDNMSAKIGVEAELESMLYSFAGIHIGLERYGKLDIIKQSDGFYKFHKSVGTSAHVGADLKILSFTLGRYDKEFKIWEIVL